MEDTNHASLDHDREHWVKERLNLVGIDEMTAKEKLLGCFKQSQEHSELKTCKWCAHILIKQPVFSDSECALNFAELLKVYLAELSDVCEDECANCSRLCYRPDYKKIDLTTAHQPDGESSRCKACGGTYLLNRPRVFLNDPASITTSTYYTWGCPVHGLGT
eukprot:gb/GECG01015837.1/.p1 GENE.gb/GECG01015837.1/~~gb/GECG01015837.1/.p1  ORF type:complete len:162 (+),score=15.12 gb/GECG01015837.1/:1-486(+)